MKIVALALMLAIAPAAAFAAGDDDPTPPKPTRTSKDCAKGKVWDKKTRKCVNARSDIFNDDQRYAAARELAYFNRFGSSLLVLDAMSDQSDTRVLTYRGFLARKTGNWEAAESYYAAALEAAPDNLLARSYLGMGLAQKGDLEAARVQLAEIRSRGGRETWPERSLLMAIRSGGASAY